MSYKPQDRVPTVLVILDGFGYNPDQTSNAIAHASKPHFDYWLATYPNTLLQASGTAVGLLPGMMGNSEVGHLTIGAGRIIEQDALRISHAIEDGTFFKNSILTKKYAELEKTQKALHIMGLLSDGGVHGHEKILFACLKVAQQYHIKKVYVHAFLDGRDVPPQSATTYLKRLGDVMKQLKVGQLASICGRFYAMDRDNNWERTRACYQMLTEKQEVQFDNWQKALDYYYEQHITDEFIPPTQLGTPHLIESGDGIIFCNYRPDRARQLTSCFVDPNFNHFQTSRLTLAFFITSTDYNHHALKTDVLFKKSPITHTLKEVLLAHHKTIFAIAETEKYAHVTYFFNGGIEDQAPGETRILIPSIPAKNYIDYPEMSAKKITQAIIESLQHNPCDFYIVNYANADMVGHSGNFEATVKAIECLDQELQKLYEEVVLKHHGTLYITGDHGNAEQMFDTVTKQPKTSHTTNPVYFIMLRKGLEHKKLAFALHGLADIAPFILQQMHIPLPSEMRRS